MNNLSIWIEKLHRAERYMSDREHGAAKAVIRQVLISMELARREQRDLEKTIDDLVVTEMSADDMARDVITIGPRKENDYSTFATAEADWMPKTNR